MREALHRHLRRPLVWTRQHRPLHWARTRLDRRAAVLMYHSVGEVDLDPWGLFVEPANFAEHLDVLRSSANPLALNDLATACAEATVAHRSVAVTFDDGYANNLYAAKPLLEAAAVPATVFIVTDIVRRSGEYWWDELADIILRPGRLPARMDLAPDDELPGDGPADGPDARELGEAVTYGEAEWRSDCSYRDGEGPASARMLLYHRLWNELVPLPDSRRRATLADLATWAGYAAAPRESHRAVTPEELLALNDGELIDIGAHTQTHPLLPQQPAEEQAREIVDGKRQLEDMLDAPVELFSYPFGANDETTVAAARGAGFSVAVTTEPETASARTEPLRIPRFDVKNWSGEEFERRLTHWLRFR